MRKTFSVALCLLLTMAGCGGGGDKPLTPDTPIGTPTTPRPTPTPTPTPAPTTLTIFTNARNPAIASLVDTTGERYNVYAQKNANGDPQNVSSVEYTAPGAEEVQIHFDSLGNVVAARFADGANLSIQRRSGNLVDASFTDSSGAKFSISGGSGDEMRSSSNNNTVVNKAIIAPLAESSQKTVFTYVKQCGRPASATVYVDIRGQASGVITRSIWAQETQKGYYQAVLPNSVEDLNIDIKTRAVAEKIASNLNSVCESLPRTIENLGNLCTAARKIGLLEEPKANKICRLAQILSGYCKVVGNAQGAMLVDRIISSLPDTTTLYRAGLYVQARAIAIPMNGLSEAVPFDQGGTINLNINLGDKCPKIYFKQIYPFYMFYYIDNKLAAIVPPYSEVSLDISHLSSGKHTVQFFGELYDVGDTKDEIAHPERAQYGSFAVLFKVDEGVLVRSTVYGDDRPSGSSTPGYSGGSTINFSNYKYNPALPPITGPVDTKFYFVIP